MTDITILGTEEAIATNKIMAGRNLPLMNKGQEEETPTQNLIYLLLLFLVERMASLPFLTDRMDHQNHTLTRGAHRNKFSNNVINSVLHPDNQPRECHRLNKLCQIPMLMMVALEVVDQN